MKKLLLSIFATAFATVANCLAQGSVMVTVTPTTGNHCSFSATSLAENVTRTVTIGSGAGGVGVNKAAFNPMVVTKAIDKCSVPLYKSLFAGTPPIPTIVISLRDASNVEILRLTLNTVFVTAITDSDSAIGPAENITLVYEKITILDPVDNTSATCNVATQICS